MAAADLLWIAIAYLSGSIPFALLIGLARGVDLRTVGSGNVGATNCGRVLGRKWGWLCFGLDTLKGLLPVLGAGVYMGYLTAGPDLLPAEAWRWLAVGAAAVVGHIFPVWLKFRGGKGVATGMGVLVAYWPTLTLPGAAALVTWAVLILIWRYMSLASVAAALMLPIYLVVISIYMGKEVAQIAPFFTVAALLAVLITLRHRSNLARLRQGTEPRLNLW